MEVVSPLTAASRVRSGGGVLIDVRTPAEFASSHAEGAVNVPLDSLTVQNLNAMTGGRRAYIFICQGGVRSKQACERVLALGLHNVATVEGGTNKWREAGLPVQGSGKQVISLERQVRIAAGILILLGTTLGIFVAPGFLAVPAFVGAGLIFAGITDWCGMALLLGRMPWNRAD